MNSRVVKILIDELISNNVSQINGKDLYNCSMYELTHELAKISTVNV